ncbi:MAG: alanine dehydrogenase [Chitinophagales bacterium]|nr:alanine dehydrogenase [Chitinophagales bacterium]MDW8392873.1 alanine dehydrogenase [Chitinophagales bacterium]
MSPRIRVPDELKGSAELVTREQPAEVQSRVTRQVIGLPREDQIEEKRIALTPESVKVLTEQGHQVLVQAGAGQGSRLSDTEYAEAGAEIMQHQEEVYQASIILKTAPLNAETLQAIPPNRLLISALHLPTLTRQFLEACQQRRLTAVAFEYLRDESDTFPIVSAMSEIAGSACIFIAAELLSHPRLGRGILLGGIAGVPPASVLILGAGTVGEFAARAALAMGAEVKVFDNNIYKLKRLQRNIGARLFTSVIAADLLLDALQQADVAIGAIHSKSGRTPIVVTEDMVSQMKPGSVIIDVSIDQGGCFESSEVTSHRKPVFKKFDVLHYCVPNIASRVPRTASQAISNVLTPMLLEAGLAGGFDRLLGSHTHLRNGVYLYRGMLTNQHLSERFQLKYTDLNLLFASEY